MTKIHAAILFVVVGVPLLIIGVAAIGERIGNAQYDAIVEATPEPCLKVTSTAGYYIHRCEFEDAVCYLGSGSGTSLQCKWRQR